jgi:N-acetylmuramoyl-L-alanine amidase
MRLISIILALLPGLWTFPLQAQETPLVVIDPGHGGEQPGVVVDGLEEEDFVLRWGFILAEAFAAAGYETHMTRTGDVGPSFQSRIDEAQAAGADLFLSLHINRNDDPTIWGTQIFLAEELPHAVSAGEAIAESLRGIGAQVELIGQPWGVLKTTDFPTMMIELGHLTHPVERRLLLSPDYWKQASDVIVEAAATIVGH